MYSMYFDMAMHDIFLKQLLYIVQLLYRYINVVKIDPGTPNNDLTFYFNH